MRRIVGAWKERGLRRLAAWAAAVVVDTLEPPDAAVLTSIPADRDRRLKRGHHPAEALARELAAAWGLSLEPLLVRVRGSPRQRELTRTERRRNAMGIFRAARGLAPDRVVLVDDVYTTGSTANAAAFALRKAGVDEVEVVTFARTIRFR